MMVRAILATTAFVLAACSGSMTLGGVTILKYGPMEGRPTAIATGTLRFEAGCTTIDVGEHSVILWPPGTSLASGDGRVHVVSDGVAVTDGDLISLGGGQYTDQHQAFIESLVGPVGPCRAETYWLGYDLRRR